MASVGHLGIIVLIHAIISGQVVPSIAYAPAPAPRPQLGAVLPAPQPASSARVKSTAGLPISAATHKRVPSTTTAVPTASPAVLTAQPLPVPPSPTPTPVPTPPPTTLAVPTPTPPPPSPPPTTQAPPTPAPVPTPPPTTLAPLALRPTSPPIVLPMPTPTPLAACCATYPENEAEIESIIVAETNAEGCSVLAGESYYYEYSGNCLIPLTATCEAVEEEGFEQLGSVGPCSVTTTETADDVINAEAEAAAEESPSPPESYCSECSLQCTALCGAGASDPYVASCALCASGNGGYCLCT